MPRLLETARQVVETEAAARFQQPAQKPPKTAKYLKFLAPAAIVAIG
jgi:hypothetical protein